MDLHLSGKTAVVTGGGTGMGRELVRQLVAEGCNVAMCDVSVEAMAEVESISSACARLVPDMRSPPSMRAISATRSSPRTGVTLLEVTPPTAALLTTRC